MSTERENSRDFASLTAYIYANLTEKPKFFVDIDTVMDIATAFIKEYPTGTDWELTEKDWETTVFEFYENYDKINTKKYFEDNFEVIIPKNMVTFIEAFRKRELYACYLPQPQISLLVESDQEHILSYINSGNYLFGKKK